MGRANRTYKNPYVRRPRAGRKARLCVPWTDDDGGHGEETRSTPTKGIRAQRREADAFRDELVAAEEARREEEARKADPGQRTLRDYLTGYLFDRRHDGTIQASTAAGYEEGARVVLDPDGGLADIPLARIAPDDIRRWQRWLMEGRGLSARSVVDARKVLVAALRRAVADGLIDRAPTDLVAAPKVRKQPPNALLRECVETVADWIEEEGPTPFATAVALAMHGGLRREEACALRWCDVDPSLAFLTVNHAIGSDHGREYVKVPKGERTRIVPTTLDLARALARRRDAMAEAVSEMRPEAPETVMPGLYVCGDVDGSRLSLQTVTRRWSALRRTLALSGTQRDRVTYHDLRHTFATYTIQSEDSPIDAVTVATIMGHVNPSMTLDVYSSPDPRAVLAAGPRIRAALLPRDGEDEPAYELPEGA